MATHLKKKSYTVIVFNAGLHDTQTDISRYGCGRTSLEVYRKNLEHAASAAKAHASIVIWVNTTPIPTGAHDQIPGSQTSYNEVADSLAKEHGFYILETTAEGQKSQNIHFTSHGYSTLGKLVSDCILAALNNQQNNICHK